MEFEWDDSKSERCLRERGFTFAFVVPAFGDPQRRVEIDGRREYGETAIVCTGGSRVVCSSSPTRCAVAPFGSFPHARPTHANGDFMVTRARLKEDGTLVEIRRDGTERPL